MRQASRQNSDAAASEAAGRILWSRSQKCLPLLPRRIDALPVWWYRLIKIRKTVVRVVCDT